ncbi:hypothetical protein EW145_g902 [Phellinidium pouzarii]|uniref:N-acetyltransferase domain-containing protein n=1 Tax=Phellinidium pouzarii TaxID=167371 RepID=A0A4S4LIE7_9AGAM|nr:hypothetical protein EW145_g902 [Phellinidium pouzarii]
MPARTDGSISTCLYRSALSIPEAVITNMRRDPRSNILLSTLEKYRIEEGRRIVLQADEFWIVCSTTRPTSKGGSRETLDFVLACTYGIIGKYPIFIYGTRLEQQLTEDYLEVRMRNIVRELHNAGLNHRVYSIFAVDPVARSFASHWTETTGINVVAGDPYYAAKFSYCTPSTLVPPPSPPQDHSYTINIRRAEETDILEVSDLCFGFAADSPPFELSEQRAIAEATQLVRKQQLWVLEVCSAHGSSIACIVALTRTNAMVTAITKVYTPPRWRNLRFAFRLVRAVCDHLFNVEKKHFVVLYVGHGNPAAHVYNRVGFVGLDPRSNEQFKLVENWLELGFDRSRVELGQW